MIRQDSPDIMNGWGNFCKAFVSVGGLRLVLGSQIVFYTFVYGKFYSQACSVNKSPS
jgi:hypothetical protein